jgi:hypothetical protein
VNSTQSFFVGAMTMLLFMIAVLFFIAIHIN